VVAADATIEGSLVAATQSSGGNGFGIGIADDAGTRGRANVTVASSVVRGSVRAGVLAYGSDVAIDASVVRDTAPSAEDGTWGRGIYADTSEASGERARVVVTRSLVDKSHDVGVFVSGSEVQLSGTLVRQTQLGPADIEARGVAVQYQPLTGHRGSVALEGCAVLSSEGAGVVALGSDLEVTSTLVADTLTDVENSGGTGIALAPWEDGSQRTVAAINASLIQGNRRAGVTVYGSDATLEATVIRGTLPQPSDGDLGWGIEVRAHTATGQRAAATIRSCLIEGNTQVGWPSPKRR
jgi:hypothetical protein